MDARSRPRVFISYKRGTHSPELVRTIARLIEDLAHLDVWFDELDEQKLHKTFVNRILKAYFPDALSLLVGLQAFLQTNLERSDVILFLQPLGEPRTPRSSWIRKKPEAGGLLASLRHLVQTFCLVWLAIFAFLFSPFLVILFVWQFAVRSLRFIERDARAVWQALTHHWLSPLWWIRRKLTGQIVPAPAFDPRTLQLQGANPSFSVIAAVQSAFYYRVIYGIQLPRSGPLVGPASWQQWELDVATALGLHPVRMALIGNEPTLLAPNPDLTLISSSHLTEDLRLKVLPHLTGRYRQALQVERRFLRGLSLVIAGFLVLVTLLLALLGWSLWWFGAWVAQMLSS